MKNGLAGANIETRITAVLMFAAVLAFAAGCATYQVRMPDSDPIERNYRRGTMHSLAWGTWYAPQVMTAECRGEGINDVRVRRNFLHDLASVVTLGFWMPIEAEFRCKAPRGDVGEFPEAPKKP